MKVLTCKQGSGEWFRARLGKPTASRFSEIVTSTGKASTAQARQNYLCELVAERLCQSITQRFETSAMERGTALEPQGRDWYTLDTGNKVETVGFVMDDSEAWGCSPDGLVADDGGLEIKCPLRTTMVKHLLADEKPKDYAVQIQGGLWVTQRKWWDLVLYTDDRGLPNKVIRYEPDAAMHDAFEEHIRAFCDDIAAAVEKLT